MKHQSFLRQFAVWRVLSSYKNTIIHGSFWLAVVQNFMLMMRLSTEDMKRTEYLATGNTVLGSVQLVLCVVIFLLYSVQNGPLRQHEMWRELYKVSHEEANLRARSALTSCLASCTAAFTWCIAALRNKAPPWWGKQAAQDVAYDADPMARKIAAWSENTSLRDQLRWLATYVARVPQFGLTDWHLLFFTFMFVAATLGLTTSPYWFCVPLLEIVNSSDDLHHVVKAVTTNGSSIIATALFGVVIVWMYAILGHATMPEAFVDEDDNEMCTTLALCWINALNEGLRGGDIGSIMEPAIMHEDLFQYAYFVVYQLSFFAIVITVLLNVIFGIIVDTFAELRSAHAAKKDNMENFCFVCGLDRLSFDTKARAALTPILRHTLRHAPYVTPFAVPLTKPSRPQGGGFERHIWEDHNMWKYLFLIVHLAEKEATEHNGWESYVHQMIEQGDVGFMPRNTAIVLKKFKEMEEKEQRRQLTHLEEVRATQAEVLRRLDSLAKVVEQGMSRDELDEKLASLSATPVGTPRLTSP